MTKATHDDQVISMWLSDKAESTIKTYSSIVKQFKSFIPQPLSQITLEELMQWREKLSFQYKITTANKKLSTIKSLFNFAIQIGYIKFNPAKVIKSLKESKDKAVNSLDATERIISNDEVRSLISAAKSHRDRLLLKTTYLLGLRVHEAINLHWQDFSIAPNGDYRVKIIGKNSKVRFNNISRDLYNELKSLDTEGYIFQSNRGKKLSRTMAHYIIKDAGKLAGLKEEVSFHWLRHCHASHSLANGASLKSVQHQLGHSSIAVTSIYLHDNNSSTNYLNI
ncbi:MAG: tyrosine-type recombinase/integrase [Nitrososphaeraceae archaeon]|nr:tyrosine-type recombinase/integrase [Nitrososphaeraceae archaeon]